MIDYSLFRYASPPRTATTWIRKAASLAGLGDPTRVDVHVPFNGRFPTKLKLTTIRRPDDWLMSYWRVIHPGVISVSPVDALRQGPGLAFDDFVRLYLENTPGGVGRMYEAYDADVCIRTEDLPWGFIKWLEALGVPKQLRERCLEMERQNVAGQKSKFALWNPSLRRRVLDAEAKTMDRFEYR